MVSGSANWSYGGGTRYDENTLFIQGNTEIALRLQRHDGALLPRARPDRAQERQNVALVPCQPIAPPGRQPGRIPGLAGPLPLASGARHGLALAL